MVPSHAFGEILLKIRPHLKPDHRLIWATKGLERNTGRLLQEVVEETQAKEFRQQCFQVPLLRKNWLKVCLYGDYPLPLVMKSLP